MGTRLGCGASRRKNYTRRPIHSFYDSTPYMITNGHVAVNVPCEDNSTASVQVLMGQAPNFTAAELENLPELSTPGEMCLYHVDIATHEEVITDMAIANPGKMI